MDTVYCILRAGRLVDRGRTYVRRVFFCSLTLILFLAGASVIAGAPTWARGLVLGGAVSLVNLLLTAGAVRSQVWGAAGKGSAFGAMAAYAARMITTVAALVFAALDDRISFWAVLPGLFAAQFVLVAASLAGWTEEKN